MADALWGEQTETFLPSFLDVLAQYYGAGMRAIDFINNAEQARLAINEWAFEQTNGKIKDLIQPNQIGSLTRLVITNTVYFDAAWADSFSYGKTSTGDFSLVNGQKARVRFMQRTGTYTYGEDKDYQALELPYDGRQVSMVIVLPKNASAAVAAAGIPFEEVATLIRNLSQTTVEAFVPKFSFTYGTVSLNQPLEDLGMKTPFSDLADFSGITGTKGLIIGNVIHQAFVAVDENGTTAAAATAVISVATATQIHPQTTVFSADHPFLFFIRDIPTGQILFMGYLAQPTVVE
jgi:serpin B